MMEGEREQEGAGKDSPDPLKLPSFFDSKSETEPQPVPLTSR